MPGHDFTKEAEHPHVVYKKRPDEFGTNAEILCNVTGDMAKTIAKRAFSSQKRQLSKEPSDSYTLELLLVLDKIVLDYHRDSDVENYALTLLNMVLILFNLRSHSSLLKSLALRFGKCINQYRSVT